MSTRHNSKMGICYSALYSQKNLAPEMAMLAAMGASSIRLEFSNYFNQSTQGVFDFTVHDTNVAEAEKYGISILGLVSCYNNASWAPVGGAPMSPQDYQTFCQQVASHYGDRITLYELGNEPDLSSFWIGGQDYVEYTAVMIAGYAGIKAGNANTIVMSAGLSGIPYNGTSHGGAPEFLQGIYDTLNGATGFDAVALHNYTGGDRPQSEMASLSRVVDPCRAIMVAEGDASKQIYITEIGFFTGTGARAEGQAAVSEALQATYMTQLYDEILTGGYGYVAALYFFTFLDRFRNVNNGNGTYTTYVEHLTDPEYNFGLIHSLAYNDGSSYGQPIRQSYKPKAAYYAYRNLSQNIVSPLPTFLTP